MKTVVVSDLHGCSMEFSALLRKAGLNRQEDRLVILGDLFDRGNHSYEVMKKVGRLHEEMGDRFFLVRGNHDQFLLDYIEGKIPLQLWALNGGLKTIESFRSHQTELDEPAALLKDTPLFVYCLSGGRSRQAVGYLQQLGYRAVTNIGGIGSYQGKVEKG